MQSSSKPVIEVKGVYKEFQRGINRKYISLRDSLSNPMQWFREAGKEKFYALEDINFDVQMGESTGIIGRNGAGKSTLLKILARITPPTRGEINMRGRVASLLEVGTGFHPELTGRENIFFNGSILGMRYHEIKKKFDEIVDFSGVESFLDTPLKHYSSGMQMRLAFSVAAHLDAEILLIDEVLAVGDAEFQKKCISKMDDVSRQEGKAILFVSHNLNQIKSLTSNSLVLDNNTIAYKGTTNESTNFYYKHILSRTNTLREVFIQTDRLDLLSIDFVDAEKKLSNLIYSGQTLDIIFKIKIKKINKCNDLKIGLLFFTINGSSMVAVRSDLNEESITLKEGHNTIKCRINKFPLSPGLYTFNLNITNKYEQVIFKKNLGEINVENGNYFISNLVPASNYQTVLIGQQWSTEN